MRNPIEHTNEPPIAEYVVIGAGPAGVCAVAKLYGSGVPGHKIIWIDSHFKVGDFGTILSVGSSVPGNTTVGSYQKVNNAIYALIPACTPTPEEKMKFEMTPLSSDFTCSLRVATQPLQYITNKLRMFIHCIEGSASVIQETPNGIRLEIQTIDGAIKYAHTKRVVLAVGAKPRTIPLPNHITIMDPNIAFIETEVKRYLYENPGISTVAVIGSSHSAALATMHLLQAGIAVKQFMNKEYKFATPVTASDGTRYTQFDNTGLKGSVAAFTRQLLNNRSMNKMWECHIGKNGDDLLATHLSGCSHAVVCIGYDSFSSLQINQLPLAAFKYDKHSTRILQANGQPLLGMFGVGVAFPLEIQAVSGEKELAVGVEKFWVSISNRILTEWQNKPARIPSRATALC